MLLSISIMKFLDSLVGITQSASAHERYFLTASELSRISEEALDHQQLHGNNFMTSQGTRQ